ncbi:MAG TPA: porin, partial [Anaeromyxobacteraceae bacterium]|nr:porin [Anaeromyxobacteraceae bacterium]
PALAPAPAPAAAPAAIPGPRWPAPTGFVGVQWSRLDAPAGGRDAESFDVRRARLQLDGELLPSVAWRLSADVAERDASRIMKDAYVALRLLPGVEVRLGQQRTPFGWEQTEDETRLLWDDAAVVAALARGPDARDVGVGLSGGWQLASPLRLEVSAALVNGAGPNTRDDLKEKNAWGRAGLALAAGAVTVKGGLSAAYGRQATPGADLKLGTADDGAFYFHRAGGDVELDSPWLFAVAELALGRSDESTGARPRQRGQYLGLYGKTPWSAGPILRLDGYDPDTRVSGNGRERVTVGLYYDLLPVAARFVASYEIDRSAPAVRTGDVATLSAQVVF